MLLPLICHLYVTRMSLVFHSMYSYVIRTVFACTRISFVCHWQVLEYHSYVTGMQKCVIRMSLVYTYMSLVCHWYVTRMYSCVICMLLVVCHSCVLLCNLSLRIKYKVLIQISRTPHKMLLVISYLFKRRKLQLFARAHFIN